MRQWMRLMFTGAAAVMIAGTARALINPKFTPVHLVNQSETILALKLSAPDGKLVIHAEVMQCLKGMAPDGKILIDLSTSTQVDWAKSIAMIAASRGDAPGMFFAGKYREEGAEDVDEIAYLQLDRDWIRVVRGKGKVWEMVAVDPSMQGTWDGGSDTLLGVIRYIIENPEGADVPVAVGVNWAERKTVGKVAGKVGTAQALDLAGDGKFVLFVASDGGDRLFAWNDAANGFSDVTDARKLRSKSVSAAWADFNGDGKVDLASWDGQKLRLWYQAVDGTFTGDGSDVSGDFGGAITGMTIVDANRAGRAALIVATPQGVMHVTTGKGEERSRAFLMDMGGTDVKELGVASGCVAADMDGNGLPEIMAIYEKASLVYAARPEEGYGPAQTNGVSSGAKGHAVVSLGDYDMDGLLDVLISGSEGCRLWTNQGRLRFMETFGHTGEFFTTAGPGAVACQACDVNNDGRQDAALFYGDGIPLIFFNRGFRSFGKSLSLTEAGTVEGVDDTKQGQQAGVVEDLNGDGAQDMALVLNNGEIMIFLRNIFEGETPLSVRAFLPTGVGPVGPVTVIAQEGKRCLGAWNVVAGASDAFVATQSAGEMLLKWTLPDGSQREKKVVVENRPLRFRIGLTR